MYLCIDLMIERCVMTTDKYRKLAFAFFMAFFMSGVMSLIITLVNIGWVSDAFLIWLRAWSFSFIVAFPTMAVVVPLANRLADWVSKGKIS